MKSRRRNRDQQPAPVAPVAPAAVDTDVTLQQLQDRLELLEQAAPAPFDPLSGRRREHDAWLAWNTRTGAEDPCPACGLAGGEQRRTGERLAVLASAWLCIACTAAVDPGWGTASRVRIGHDAALDRLACLAAGMAAPTPGFRTLARRYGLEFSLSADAPGEPSGRAWGHLDAEAWARVGSLAVRRHEAGYGVLPTPQFLRPGPAEMVLRTVPHGSGRRLGYVPVSDPGDLLRWDADALAAEEAAVGQVLKDRARAVKEEEAAAARERREGEIRAHYREHVARLDAEAKRQRAILREQLGRALDAAL